jgi:hypothetical protein
MGGETKKFVAVCDALMFVVTLVLPVIAEAQHAPAARI